MFIVFILIILYEYIKKYEENNLSNKFLLRYIVVIFLLIYMTEGPNRLMDKVLL